MAWFKSETEARKAMQNARLEREKICDFYRHDPLFECTLFTIIATIEQERQKVKRGEITPKDCRGEKTLRNLIASYRHNVMRWCKTFDTEDQAYVWLSVHGYDPRD